jgi:hypothetical protein
MDIKKVTLEILSTGLTEQQLAHLIPCSQSLINAFKSGKRGKRTSLVIGERLRAIHAERCPVRRRKTDQQ